MGWNYRLWKNWVTLESGHHRSQVGEWSCRVEKSTKGRTGSLERKCGRTEFGSRETKRSTPLRMSQSVVPKDSQNRIIHPFLALLYLIHSWARFFEVTVIELRFPSGHAAKFTGGTCSKGKAIRQSFRAPWVELNRWCCPHAHLGAESSSSLKIG